MRGILCVIVPSTSALIAVAAGAAAVDRQPQYKLKYLPLRRVECTLDQSVSLPGLSLKEWLFFQVKPPQGHRAFIDELAERFAIH
jgi:hypothetical protein